MRRTTDGKAKGPMVRVHKFDPVDGLEVHDIAAGVTEDHAVLLEPQAQKIVGILFHLLLKIGDGAGGLFGNAASVQGPALVAGEELDDDAAFDGDIAREHRESPLVALEYVLGAVLVRIAPGIIEMHVTGHVARVAELREAALAERFANLEVRGAAESIDELLEDLLGLRGALIRHHGFWILRRGAEGSEGSDDDDGRREGEGLQPHRMDPPFTLMISPVRKLARSEARKRMEPAISSAVAARPRGIAALIALAPSLVLMTGLDMSVETQPGATQFTRMLWRGRARGRTFPQPATHPPGCPGCVGNSFPSRP